MKTKTNVWRIALLATLLVVAMMSIAAPVLADDTPNCPDGQGYWKNTATWPVVGLTLGSQVYSQAELLILFNTPVAGDASINLAHQLIAATLNVANGDDAVIASGVIAQANTVLALYPNKLPYNVASSSTDGQTMVNLAGVLDSYNNGQLTVNCTTIPTATPEATVEVTVEATAEVTPEATAEATPNPDDDGGITIVIEGPVQEININIITIYNIDIELDNDDPNLTIIQLGDIVRIEGDTNDFNGTIIIVAVTVVIVNVDINIDTGEVFRDQGNCNNPPPPWAPANGWRRRCGDINVNVDINDNVNGMGMGMGMGMGNDDNDDD